MSVATALVRIFAAVLSLCACCAAGGGWQCENDFDCSLAGHCVGGECICDDGFVGAGCEHLNVSPNVTRTISGLPGATVPGTKINTVWGGHSLRDEAGLHWHWFGSVILDGGGLGDWSTNSAAGHAVGRDPVGLVLKEIVLRPNGDSTSWCGGSIHG
eukprot:SAG31_NODE_3174_length_4587_cov_7.232843_1_plen_157_part_00